MSGFHQSIDDASSAVASSFNLRSDEQVEMTGRKLLHAGDMDTEASLDDGVVDLFQKLFCVIVYHMV